MTLILRQVAFAAALAAACTAHATTITFDNAFDPALDHTRQPIDASSPSYSEGGYTMSVIAGHLDFLYDTSSQKIVLQGDSAFGQPDTGPRIAIFSKTFTIEGRDYNADQTYTVLPALQRTPDGLAYAFADTTYGGGILDVKADDKSQFTFSSVDYVWSYSYFATYGQATFTGYLNGNVVGVQYFGGASSRFDPFNFYTGTVDNNAGNSNARSGWSTASLSGVVMDELQITLPAANVGIFTPTGETIDNLVLNTVTAAVPEPASWAMALLGLGVIVGAARHRRRSESAATA